MGGMSRNSLGGAAQLSPYLNFDPSYLQVFSYLPMRVKISCPSKILFTPFCRLLSQTTFTTLRQSVAVLKSLSLPLEAAFAWVLGLVVLMGSLMALGGYFN